MAYETESNWEFAEHPWLLAGCRLKDAQSCMQLSFCIYSRWPLHTEHWEQRVEAYRKGRKLGHGHYPIIFVFEDKMFSIELMLKQARAGYLVRQVAVGLRFAGGAHRDYIEAYAWLKTALTNPSRWALWQASRSSHWEGQERSGKSVIWFLERVLDEQELRSAKSLAKDYMARFPPRRIGVLRRWNWFFDEFNDFAEYPKSN